MVQNSCIRAHEFFQVMKSAPSLTFRTSEKWRKIRAEQCEQVRAEFVQAETH